MLPERSKDDAIHKFGLPPIMNMDQGSQFTSVAGTAKGAFSPLAIMLGITPLGNGSTTVANSEIRVCLSVCLGERFRGQGGHQKEDRLQSQATALLAWRQAACRGLLA